METDIPGTPDPPLKKIAGASATMETDIPGARDPQLAKIAGIQFGLMTTRDIFNLSVYERANGPLFFDPKNVSHPKLGLPTKEKKCETCDGVTVEQCEGHFGHSHFSVPIYHPHHVGKLVTLLRKICLNCGNPKKKPPKSKQRNVAQRKKSPDPLLEGRECTPPPCDDDENYPDDYMCSQSSKTKRKFAEAFVDVEAREGKRRVQPDVVELPSESEDFSFSVKGKQFELDSEVEEGDYKVENKVEVSSSSVRRSWNFGKGKSPTDSNGNNSTTTDFYDLTRVETITWNPLSKRKRTRNGEDSQSKTDAVGRKSRRHTGESLHQGICMYCSGEHTVTYPDIQLKVVVREGGKDGNVCKNIKMMLKVKLKDFRKVAPDYWSFVEGKSAKPSKSSSIRSRLLLPSEALKIINKIPRTALTSLGVHPTLARPEALIMEIFPVPPNCTRIEDDSFDATNLGFKHGIDRPTLMFRKLLSKAKSISKSRSAFGKPSFAAAAVEANELQSLFGQYIREKGAPKAVPGQEKRRVDHVGRVQKRDGRWSLDWLKRHVLGKRSGFAARNVVTGDPYLKVEEIGIPREVAKYVTVPERVHRFNKKFLQDCVDVGQSLTGRYRACGAVRLTSGGERLEVTRNTQHELKIGDVVHRHIKDGDLVYVNRPPSLHKHSLLALRVQVHDESVFTINPAICAPLHADFDGDCLHLFVPQSEECRAELHQLMTLPQQLLPSSDGKTIIGLSQDNILATYLMTSTAPSFVNKEQMHQLAIWCSNRRLPIPVVVKSPVGPQWASKQVIDMTIPMDFSYRSEDGDAAIKDGEILSPGHPNWLTSTNGLVRALAQQSPQVAVDHLDCSQSVLREWLLLRGFSVSLKDLYGFGNSDSHERLIEDLLANIDEEQNMAVNKELIFDEQFQKLDVIEADLYLEPLEAKMRTEALEDISIGYFMQKFGEIGEEIVSSIGCDNNLLAMVRSGSKGSFGKAFQQFGCLGLQLHKGEHLLALNNNNKLLQLASSLNCEDKWEARGLVKSSLLQGLDALEFFLHAIAVRAGLLRQSFEVTEPGELFKRLMLFMRDLYISYDGTVRNKSGAEIVGFSYDGGRTLDSNQDSPSAKESVMPGEAVGVLTATAIAQPAYQVMLEASHNVASKKIRPLALLQETIFPLRTSKLKIADRRNILRLKECLCDRSHCLERRCLCVTDQLQPVNIQMLATAAALEYVLKYYS